MNFKLYFDGQHFVGDKRFDTVQELVADGLICMYMDLHAADYIRNMTDQVVYEESPYIQYQRMTQRSKKKTLQVRFVRIGCCLFCLLIIVQ